MSCLTSKKKKQVELLMDHQLDNEAIGESFEKISLHDDRAE